MEDGDLTYFYTDNSNKIQGPFAADLVLRWFENKMLCGNIKMRITDNGMRIGDRITYDASLGEIQEQFGTVPTNINQIKFRGIRIVKDVVVGSENLHQPSSYRGKQENSDEEPRRVISRPQNSEQLLPLCSRNLDETRKSNTLLMDPLVRSEQTPGQKRLPPSLEHIFDDLNSSETPSPRRNAYAGPELPPGLHVKPKSDMIGKMDKEPTRRTKMAAPYCCKDQENRSQKKKQNDGLPYLPFYDGSSEEGNTVLPKVVAIELMAYLQRMFLALSENARKNIREALGRHKLPISCSACACEWSDPRNYIYHVLTQKHVKKSIDEKKIQFTFEKDYLEMKKVLEHESKAASSVETAKCAKRR